MKKVPFQSCKKYRHKQISALTEEFNLTRWWGFLASGSSENSCRRNALPGCITDAAWLKWTRRDSSSFLVHGFLPDHLSMRSFNLHNLSRSCSCSATVSIRIPKTVTTVAGPSSFDIETGMLRSSKVSRTNWHGVQAWSSGCTATIQYAFFKLILMRWPPTPCRVISATASSTDEYRRQSKG